MGIKSPKGVLMHIILGGTGHVGSALAEELLARGEPITIVTRDASKNAVLERTGARVAIADAHDADALRRVFRTGERLFLLNPPAPPSSDTEAEERRSLTSILSAIEGSGLKKIVAESTQGAQRLEPGGGGDLGVLFEMEQALAAQPIPSSIIRAAYYMSNWDGFLESAAREGVIASFFPADFMLPMVAPKDLGRVAADLMTEPIERTGLHDVEGPKHYSASDVAAAFSAALKRKVTVNVIPRERWLQTFRELGFSEAAAASYAGMTGITLDRRYEPSAPPVRGKTSLESYVTELVRRSSAESSADSSTARASKSAGSRI
jgi:uncharacterized protein YbjT (DUF2867 family)